MTKLYSMCIAMVCVSLALLAHAQPSKPHRIGVIYFATNYQALVEGLRAGLKDFRLDEGKDYVLHLRDTGGDLGHVNEMARQLEREQIDLLFTVSTEVTKAASRATRDVPIVFYAGSDPVEAGLVESFSKPGGRMTGVHHRRVELVPKRMDIMRQLLPNARRVITFHDQRSAVARLSASKAREAARSLGIELVEREVSSPEQVVQSVRALRPGEVDGYFLIGDPTVTPGTISALPLAVERKIPVMAHDMYVFNAGAFAAYGVNHYDIGRTAARHVKRVLDGTRPRDVAVEIYDKVQLALNLRIARELGITIPDRMIVQADFVIQ